MSKRDDGGPAYPCDPDKFWSYKGEPNSEAMGMSLRDYFAGQALVGFLASTPTDWQHDGAALPKPHDVADWCGLYADAMIAERSKE